FDKASTRRSLQKLRVEAAGGEASRVIDRFARWKGPEKDSESWQIIIDFAWDVARRAAKSHPNPNKGWLSDKPPIRRTKDWPEAPYLYSKEQLTILKGGEGFIRADGIACQFQLEGVFVSSNGLMQRRPTQIHRSIVVVSGSVRVAQVSESIVICDGDVEISGGLIRSVVIANGQVKCGEDVTTGSVLATSSKVNSGRPKNGKLDGAKRNLYLEHEPTPFDFVKWF